MKFNIIFSLMAVRDAYFFGRIAQELTKRGFNPSFITFHESCVPIIKQFGFDCVSVHSYVENFDSGLNFSIGDIGEIEKAYKIRNIRQTYMHDRFTFGDYKNESELVNKFYSYLKAVEKIFDIYSPNYVVQELGGFIAQQSVFFASQKRGVECLFLEPAIFPGRLFFTYNSLEPPSLSGVVVTDEDIRRGNEYRRNYLKCKSVNMPSKDHHHYRDVNLRKLFSFDTLNRMKNKVLNKYVIRRREEFDNISRNIQILLLRYCRRKILSFLYSQPVSSEKYVYYPLHVPHDFQIYIRSPEFKDQESLIEYVSRCLPYGYKLYIKEHPACIGSHSLFRLYECFRLGNVRLLHPGCNSFQIIRNAQCVVTVNSKVGAESVMQGKSTVVMGKAVYRGMNVTQDVSSLGEVDLAIRKAIDNPVDDLAVQSFLGRAHAASWPGELYNMSQENIMAFTNSMLDSIRLRKRLG